MSDDLVKRLRQSWDADRSIISQTDLWMTERVAAATRIEELEATGLANRVAIMRLEAKLAACEKYRDAYAECDRIGTQAVRELEAKLAKAVEGFEELARLGNGDRYGNSFGNLIAQRYIAELTGGKDE
jgi:hypothetical protein